MVIRLVTSRFLVYNPHGEVGGGSVCVLWVYAGARAHKGGIGWMAGVAGLGGGIG
jgi:hypothetical protein